MPAMPRLTVLFHIHPIKDQIPVVVFLVTREEFIAAVANGSANQLPVLPNTQIPVDLQAALGDPNPHGLLALVVERVVQAGYQIMFLSHMENNQDKLH